jgi:hypothetical protein
LDFKNPDSDQSKWLTYEQLADLYKSLAEKYPIVSIEDPFAEDDWEAWSYFFKTSDFQIVGDDLTVTNPAFIKKAIELKSCNALLLKVNQIGTITEAIQAAKDAFGAGWGVMVSHRSGETEDVTIGKYFPSYFYDICANLPQPISSLVSAQDRSRPALRLVPSVSLSSTRFSASRRSSAATPFTLATTSEPLSTCRTLTSDRSSTCFARWHPERRQD